MVYITQLIYIYPGQEHVFNQFEAVAIPIIAKYRGKLLLRMRPDEYTYIEHHIEKPYEIHLVSFDSIADFESFKQDEARKQFMHLKEQSVKEAWLIQGTRLA